MKKLTLEELLDWAKETGVYIEILGSGETEIQFPPDFERRVYADSLREALIKARKRYRRGPAWTRKARQT